MWCVLACMCYTFDTVPPHVLLYVQLTSLLSTQVADDLKPMQQA